MLLLATVPALADYFPPSHDQLLQDATSVIDVTIESFDDDGHATLDVHQTLVGVAPDHLFGAVYSCFGDMPISIYGVEAGKRYVVITKDAAMFEETTFFEVRGDLEVDFWASAEGTERTWQSLNSVRERIRSVRDKR